MPDTNPTLTIRSAVRCVAGAARDSNEDAAYAGERLLAVADGMRGPGGAARRASWPSNDVAAMPSTHRAIA